jgi:hypothetical protein
MDDRDRGRRDLVGMRRARWIAWSACVLTWGLGALGLVLWAFNRSHPQLGAVVEIVSFQAVGLLILARRPNNRIGWIFCTISLLDALWVFTTQYATYALVTKPAALVGASGAAWLSSWMWAPPLWLTGTLTLLLFPDGRLPSRRWRPVPWLALSGLALFVGALALTPWQGRANLAAPQEIDASATGPLAIFRLLLSVVIATAPSEVAGRVAYPMDNPLGLRGANAALATAAAVGALLILISFLACVSAPILRLWRARGTERQQVKWMAYVAVMAASVFVAINTLVPRSPDLALVLILGATLPVAAALAILRHHMYDIDLVINRTLVYGLLTAILGLAYAAAVLVLGQLFGGVAGNPPSWAVAGATLSVWALFRPARARIQAVVDRRFNRRSYDAAKTVEAFSARLRDQVDLNTLSAELLAVVDQTMQPTTFSLWLRPPTHGSPGASHSAAGPASTAHQAA